MDSTELAKVGKALGDPTRARIFQFLLGCCCPVTVEESGEVRSAEGPTAGEVCCQITGATKITSTISFHLKELREAGLIKMDKRGKEMVCEIDRDTLERLAVYFSEAKECACGPAACCA